MWMEEGFGWLNRNADNNKRSFICLLQNCIHLFFFTNIAFPFDRTRKHNFLRQSPLNFYLIFFIRDFINNGCPYSKISFPRQIILLALNKRSTTTSCTKNQTFPRNRLKFIWNFNIKNKQTNRIYVE